jgi:hypothetical protein
MIAGIFHAGSGLGNQLFRYVATRVLALDKGYKWGMCNPELFKGDSFMKIDKGINPPDGDVFTNVDFQEKRVEQDGLDIRGYDPEINFVKDNTVIDGEFQDPKYFEHRKIEIDGWLKTEPLEVPEDTCVIGFRGGEYVGVPDLFLTIDYWNDAIEIMRDINPDMRFEVHTDDPATAEIFFPNYPIIQDIGINWRSMRYAKFAIIANSSFYILPRWRCGGMTIAPRYWARRNIGIWALPQNYYKQFFYL